MEELKEQLVKLVIKNLGKCLIKGKAPSKRILSTLDKIIDLNSLNQYRS